MGQKSAGQNCNTIELCKRYKKRTKFCLSKSHRSDLQKATADDSHYRLVMGVIPDLFPDAKGIRNVLSLDSKNHSVVIRAVCALSIQDFD